MNNEIKVKSDDYKLTVKGRELIIRPDECPQDPQNEDCPLAIIKGMHKRYNIGQRPCYIPDNFTGWDDFYQELVEDWSPVVISPVYMMDHSRLVLSMKPFGGLYGRFDSGRVGYIFVPVSHLSSVYGWQSVDEERKKELKKAMEESLNTYEKYLNGDMWVCTCLKDGEVIDCCGGIDDIRVVKDIVPEEFIELAEIMEEN